MNGSPATPITPATDGGLRLRYEGERGHIYLSTILRELAVRLPNGDPQESTLGWGLNRSSTWRIAGRDTLNYQAAYGDGIARYTGDAAFLGLDAQQRSNTDLTLKALPVFPLGQLSAPLDQIRPIQRYLRMAAGAEHRVRAGQHLPQEQLFLRQRHLESVRQPLLRRRVHVWLGPTEGR